MSSSDVNITSMRHLLPELKSGLQSFTSSPDKFRLSEQSHLSHHLSRSQTLYVLTPPTTLLQKPICRLPPQLSSMTVAPAPKTPAPPRDAKCGQSAKPAPFEHRLVMMTIFAEDLRAHLAQQVRLEEGGGGGRWCHDGAVFPR
jgi:hypothetical protein